MIAEEGVLADTKLIAEPWDAAGLYQVGHFPYGRRWSEWNGQYRDQVRRFWRGEPGQAGALASRLCGSADLYEASGRLPRHSLNFVTCHDGFTLWDLVSYNHKHNEANGEGNRDGSNDNYSWNCGPRRPFDLDGSSPSRPWGGDGAADPFEGPTDHPEVPGLRRRQVRNLLATLFLSQGVPLLLAGDEFLRTQRGNNNAWCQDNEVSWVDWSLAAKNADFLRFVRELIALRRRHPALRRPRFFRGAEVVWHGVEPFRPDFSRQSHTVALALDGRHTGREPDRDLYMAFNAWMETLFFAVPPAPQGRPWRRVIDTALASPLDIVGLDEGPRVPVGTRYAVAPFSTLVLIAEA
jgi:glycogen operon protein